MALGAARADVVRIVVGQGLSLAAIGVVIGLGGALALTRLLKTMLFGIGWGDGRAAAPIGMLLVALLAACLPALRATRISPLVALRHEKAALRASPGTLSGHRMAVEDRSSSSLVPPLPWATWLRR
jgi:predicted lysophospholipase L1 biosynthesis ABC-type transport system permease subunit